MTDTSPEALIARIRAHYAGRVLTDFGPVEQDIIGLCNQVEKLASETRELRAENKVWNHVMDRMFAAMTRREY